MTSSAPGSGPDPVPPDRQQPVHDDPTTPVMSHSAARRRGRLLLPGVFVLGIVVVFLIIVLVGRYA